MEIQRFTSSSWKEKKSSWHTFHLYLSEHVSDFMTDSIPEIFSHHCHGLYGCMDYLARDYSMLESSWIWSDMKLVTPVYKNIIQCNKRTRPSAASEFHSFSIVDIKRKRVVRVLNNSCFSIWLIYRCFCHVMLAPGKVVALTVLGSECVSVLLSNNGCSLCLPCVTILLSTVALLSINGNNASLPRLLLFCNKRPQNLILAPEQE